MVLGTFISFVCFIIVVVGNSTVARLVGLACAWINPVYAWEAFIPPYPFLISPSFPKGFSQSPIK